MVFPDLRTVTVAVTSIAAVAVASLTQPHHPSPAEQASSPPAAASPMAVREAVSPEPGEPKGRVQLWQDAKRVAAEEAAAAAAAQAAAAQQRRAAPTPPPNYGSGPIQDIITNAFSPYGPTAVAWGLRVARCESGFNPRAYNPAGPYYGLFQFLMSTFKATPYGSGDIYDPVANANAAAWKYANGGASAWGCK